MKASRELSGVVKEGDSAGDINPISREAPLLRRHAVKRDFADEERGPHE